MTEMKFICMYKDYVEIFRQLTDARRGRLIMAILEYAFCGTEPELRGEERLAYSMLRSQVQRDRAKYDEACQRNRANGMKGGRPKKPKGLEENPTVFEKPIEKEIEREKENIKENENDKEKEKESSIIGAAPGVQPPPKPDLVTPDEIRAYCLSMGLFHVDPDKFYDYYAAKGWKLGKEPMADWRAALRSWERKDAEKAVRQENDAYAQNYYDRFLHQYGVDARLERMQQEYDYT